jgi:preprotein translocase subunit SecG
MLNRKVIISIVVLFSISVLGLSVFWMNNNDDAEEDAINNNVPLSKSETS